MENMNVSFHISSVYIVTDAEQIRGIHFFFSRHKLRINQLPLSLRYPPQVLNFILKNKMKIMKMM